jgi:DNA polymerase-3 subunit gamma/tau
VKFLFATTEVNKVPITVLSRCQRFDLRRIPAEKLAAHFAAVVAAEGVEAEPEALALIARAAEGSARDGLSILDQAIAHGSGTVEAAQVRDMLGLSDRGAIRRLFADLLKGDAAAVLAGVRSQHELGVEPAAMLHGLLETCHGVTRAKVAGTDDPALSTEEREAYAEWAGRLGFATLHRLWQLLLKGHGEVQTAAMPVEAAEMALLRVVHASQLPDPGEIARKLAAGGLAASDGGAPAPAAPESQAALLALPATAEALHIAIQRENALLAQLFHDYAAIVRLAGAELVISRHPRLPDGFPGELGAALRRSTGERWTIAFSDEAGEPSLFARARAEEGAARTAILESPLVKATFQAFPEAELIDYSGPEPRSLAS